MAIALITFLTFINTRGVKGGKVIQNTFTLTKLLSLFGLIGFGFLALKGGIWHANWSNAWDIHHLGKDGSITSLTLGGIMGAIAAVSN